MVDTLAWLVHIVACEHTPFVSENVPSDDLVDIAGSTVELVGGRSEVMLLLGGETSGVALNPTLNNKVEVGC